MMLTISDRERLVALLRRGRTPLAAQAAVARLTEAIARARVVESIDIPPTASQATPSNRAKTPSLTCLKPSECRVTCFPSR